MLRGMKEICTEATSSCQGHKLMPLLALRAKYKVPVTVQEDVEDAKIWSDFIKAYPCIEMLDERKEQRHFARGCLLNSMTFYKFSKTWSQFP